MRPRPDDITMHACLGQPRYWMAPELFAHASCRTCRAPVAAEQPWLEGHAGMRCDFCGEQVGFCGGGLLAAVLHDAETLIGR